jgi:hopanoid biosynthesis associated RND transporter like protein HpnN
MLRSTVARIVGFCTAHPVYVLLISSGIVIASVFYTVGHFAISTDINQLISPDLDWRKRELALDAAYPARTDFILAVVDAPRPELATQATTALLQRLRDFPKLFHSIREQGGGEFFQRNGLLFTPTAELEQTAKGLGEASPLIGTLSDDPSLRGLTKALSLGLLGVQKGKVTLDALARPLGMAADTIEDVLSGRPAHFSWQVMLKGEPAQPRDLRRFIEARPVLDYGAIEPGKVGSDAIRKAADDLQLGEKFGARVRLTGPVPIADEEFATVQEGAAVNGIATVIIVLVILWLALRSARIILAVFATLIVGLTLTAALGLVMVGALNMISVAFAVLFVGLGVDFGIQFAVRYRAERHEIDDLRIALLRAAKHAGPPLTLAAAAVAAGFLSFLPTAYRGVSELGQIAGVGMIVAFLANITVLPALLMLLNPPGEKEPVGYRALAPVDRFLDKHRIPVLAGTALVVLLGLPLLFHLRFDFNPINLRSPKVESIATYLDLRTDPEVAGNPIEVLASSQAEADSVAARIAKVPEVDHVVTLDRFVPEDQDKKLPIIQELASTLGPDISGPQDPRPSDAENIAALTKAASDLTTAANGNNGPGAIAAKRLSADLTRLADADPATRQRAETAFTAPLKTALDDLRNLLKAERVTTETLPRDLVNDWVAPDGRTRVEAYPKGDPNDNEVIRRFARAVLAVQPNAIGGPVSILESGDTIVGAFIQAGIWAVISIAILLWIVLRRIGDVLLTLIPLLTAGAVTLEITVLIGLPLNFANIIALPLLLGLGVAFKIYYIMAWRAGQTNLLQTSLTRAVIFSAMTTATAFGSLWLSHHPGTSSMGELLALSLACTLAAAVLFQPALMGRPRGSGDA